MIAIVVRTARGGRRTIPADKLWVDRSTGPGEDADYYERTPDGGLRWIRPRSIIERLDQ